MLDTVDIDSRLGAGVEIRGLDLHSELSDSVKEELRVLFAREHMFLLRGADIDADEHCRFVEILGTPLQREPQFVSKDMTESFAPAARLLFHSDKTWGDAEFAVSLWAERVSPTSSPTTFVNAVRSYEELDPPTRALVDELHAVHIGPQHRDDFEGERFRYGMLPGGVSITTYRRRIRPLAECVLNSDAKSLFVNEQLTSHIAEMPGSDGEALIQELFHRLYQEENIYTHRWAVGDLLIWNNMAVQHGRPENRDNNPRRMRRFPLISPHQAS